MVQMKSQINDLRIADSSNSVLELIFPGGKFALERKVIPFVIGINYLIVCCVGLLVSGLYNLEHICVFTVILSLGGTILSRVRGRWLALMIFTLPLVFDLLKNDSP